MGESSARGDRFVPLAVIVGAHGVQGELRVKPHNPQSELLWRRERLWLRAPASEDCEPRRVQSARPHKDLVLLMLEGTTDRDAALRLRGSELLLPRAELPRLDAGEHYLVDLVGLRVALRDGSHVGQVENVIVYPSCDALSVATERGVLEVPLLPPYFVEADLERGVVIVDELSDLDLLPKPRAPGKGSSQEPA